MKFPLSDALQLGAIALLCLIGMAWSARQLLRSKLPPGVDNHYDLLAKHYAAAFVGLACLMMFLLIGAGVMKDAAHETFAAAMLSIVAALAAIAMLVAFRRGLMAFFAAQDVRTRLAATTSDDDQPTS